MRFFKKPRNHIAKQEQEIQAIRKDTLKRVDKATRSIDKLNDLLDDPNLGITGKIFLATGGGRRK